jgi:hypothetical protein
MGNTNKIRDIQMVLKILQSVAHNAYHKSDLICINGSTTLRLLFALILTQVCPGVT